MQFKLIAFFTILVLLAFSGCNKKDSEDKTILEQIEDKNSYQLTTSTAKTLHIKVIEEGLVFSEYENKAVLLNFISTWCLPCMAEITHLNNLREKYHNDFEIITVLLEDNKTSQELKAFIQEKNIQFPVTASKQNELLAAQVGGIKEIPTMFMYNKNGNLVETYTGIVPQEMLEMDIKKAIK